MTERSRITMAFIPGESIHRILFEYLSETEALRVERANIPLGFESYRSYVSENPDYDLALRRFRKTAEGAYVPLYPSLAAEYYRKPGEGGTPTLGGIRLTVAADMNENDDLAREAELLGFAYERNLVIARLALRLDQISPRNTHDAATRKLKGLLAAPIREMVEVTLLETEQEMVQ